MESGQVVLVTAAAGGTGQFAVQVCHCYVLLFFATKGSLFLFIGSSIF